MDCNRHARLSFSCAQSAIGCQLVGWIELIFDIEIDIARILWGPGGDVFVDPPVDVEILFGGQLVGLCEGSGGRGDTIWRPVGRSV